MTFDILKLGVAADDLTGAGDAGAALAWHGWPALILVNGIRDVVGLGSGPPHIPFGWSALVINTESRHLSSAAASRRTAAACRWLARAGATRIFKKIDSTLRGHPMEESLAGAKAVKARRIPWVPAFPAAGRTTVGGVHCVDGRPVAETFAGRDPQAPVRESRLPALIRERLGRDAQRFSVPLSVKTTADLRRIARAFRHDRYAAGSAGFLDALLPFWMGRPLTPPSPPGGERDQGRGVVLLVCGSASPAARRQLAAYRKRFPGDPVVAAPVRRGDPDRVMRGMVKEAVRQAGLLNKSKVKSDPTLILVGGETAWRVATRLGIRGLAVRKALAPGVAGCEVIMATNGMMGARVVLKPGGFGGDDILLRARRWISG